MKWFQLNSYSLLVVARGHMRSRVCTLRLNFLLYCTILYYTILYYTYTILYIYYTILYYTLYYTILLFYQIEWAEKLRALGRTLRAEDPDFLFLSQDSPVLLFILAASIIPFQEANCKLINQRRLWRARGLCSRMLEVIVALAFTRQCCLH